MSDTPRVVSRAALSREERAARSRLAQLVHDAGMVRGGLSVRKRRCGAAQCKCTRGELHASLYLATSQDGSQRQLYVPPLLDATVREWAARYQEIRDLLEVLSRLHWEKIKHREV